MKRNYNQEWTEYTHQLIQDLEKQEVPPMPDIKFIKEMINKPWIFMEIFNRAKFTWWQKLIWWMEIKYKNIISSR